MPITSSGSKAVQVRIIHGHHSVFAAEPIAAGETILEFDGAESSTPGRHSIQIGTHRHLSAPVDTGSSGGQEGPPWQFLNHSCAPNAFVRGRSLVALGDIPSGVEVTFDYNTTEWDMADPFECSCGEPSCLGFVRGYRWLSEAARESRRELTAPYLVDAEALAEPVAEAR